MKKHKQYHGWTEKDIGEGNYTFKRINKYKHNVYPKFNNQLPLRPAVLLIGQPGQTMKSLKEEVRE